MWLGQGGSWWGGGRRWGGGGGGDGGGVGGWRGAGRGGGSPARTPARGCQRFRARLRTGGRPAEGASSRLPGRCGRQESSHPEFRHSHTRPPARHLDPAAVRAGSAAGPEERSRAIGTRQEGRPPLTSAANASQRSRVPTSRVRSATTSRVIVQDGPFHRSTTSSSYARFALARAHQPHPRRRPPRRPKPDTAEGHRSRLATSAAPR